MNKEEYLDAVSKAQKSLNKLLLGACQHELNYRLLISEVNCVPADGRTVVGVAMYDSRPLYVSDGVP